MFGMKRSPPHTTPASAPPSAAGVRFRPRAKRSGPGKKSIYTRVNSEVSGIAGHRQSEAEIQACLSHLEDLRKVQSHLSDLERDYYERQQLRQRSSMDKTLDRATKTRIWWVEIRPILLTLVPIAGWGYGFVYSVSHHNPVLTVSTVAVGACSGAGVLVANRRRTRKSPPGAPEDLSRPPESAAFFPRPAQGVGQDHLVGCPAGHPDEVGTGHDDGHHPGPRGRHGHPVPVVEELQAPDTENSPGSASAAASKA